MGRVRLETVCSPGDNISVETSVEEEPTLSFDGIMTVHDLNRSYNPHCPPAVNFTGIGVPRLWLGHLYGDMKMACAGMLQEYSGKRRQPTQTHRCGTVFMAGRSTTIPKR